MAQSGAPLIKREEDETTFLLKLGPFPRPIEERKVTLWDEKGRTEIAQIFISYGTNIVSLAFQYIENGKLVMSSIFGSQHFIGTNFVAVKINDGTNKEYVTRVSGSYDLYSDGGGITSLTIETNARSYGPFGNPKPKNTAEFNLSFGPEDQFGGFYGSSFPDYVRSIGVYLKPTVESAALAERTELPIE